LKSAYQSALIIDIHFHEQKEEPEGLLLCFVPGALCVHHCLNFIGKVFDKGLFAGDESASIFISGIVCCTTIDYICIIEYIEIMEKETLSKRELRRYSKQIMIPEIGIRGQEKLKQSNVLVVGAGGLGCPVLQYLSAAGVGKLSIVDFDLVDETNLSRQVLYGSSDLGKLKSIIAKSRLEYLNPLTTYNIINCRLDSSNALNFLKDFDVIVDATDNLEARYVINDACVFLKKPMVHGSIFKYEGMISVFNYRGGPSYRDFNPEQINMQFRNPAPGSVGFFGVLPGITGTYMANEVIKIITESGKILSGSILVINIHNNTFSTFSFNEVREEERINELKATLATV
jgi:adenylyltransferase/sulfurtransferase